jgi:acyl-CoA synthetase (NDP forming)
MTWAAAAGLGGSRIIISVTQDPDFGPLVPFGLGGGSPDALADHAAGPAH